MSEIAHELSSPVRVKVEGTFVIKDKNGNIKGHSTFSGSPTKEQMENFLGRSLDLNKPTP